jgi:hypothetical protein
MVGIYQRPEVIIEGVDKEFASNRFAGGSFVVNTAGRMLHDA